MAKFETQINDDASLVMVPKDLLIKERLGQKARNKQTIAERLKKGVEAGTIVKDLIDVAKILKEFGMNGKFTEKLYNGKVFIIFKGLPGGRHIFTGTRYLQNHHKVVSLGLGRMSAAKKMLKGSILTITVFAAIDFVDFLLRDEKTLVDFGVQLAVDIVKTAVAGAIAWGAATAAATTGIVVLPAAVFLVVSIVVSMGVDYIVDRYNVIESLTQATNEYLDELNRNLNNGFRQFERSFMWHMLCQNPNSKACQVYFGHY